MTYDYRNATIVKARTKPVDSTLIQDIKRDAELLVSNWDRVHNEEDYEQLFQATIAWRRKNLDGRYNQLMVYLRKEIEYIAKSPERQMQIYRKALTPLFKLESAITPPSDYENWLRNRIRWKTEVEAALAGFSAMSAWLDKLPKGSKKLRPTYEDSEPQNLEIYGFNCELADYNVDNPQHREFLALLREGLRVYQAQAKRYMPQLLRRKLGITIEFGPVGFAGEYRTNRIALSARNITGVDEFVKVLAHENGHYYFAEWMSSAAQARWRNLLSKELREIDLGEFIRDWPASANIYQWRSMLKDSDPLKYLQLEAMLEGWAKLPTAFVKADNWTREGFEQYLADHGPTKVTVLHTPITAYAHANASEAFCDTIGNLVAFGPQAVHPDVRRWLSIVMPGEIRIARQVGL